MLPGRTPVVTRVLCVRVMGAAATGHVAQSGASAAQEQDFFKFNFNKLKFQSPPWWMAATSRDSTELIPVKMLSDDARGACAAGHLRPRKRSRPRASGPGLEPSGAGAAVTSHLVWGVEAGAPVSLLVRWHVKRARGLRHGRCRDLKAHKPARQAPVPQEKSWLQALAGKGAGADVSRSRQVARRVYLCSQTRSHPSAAGGTARGGRAADAASGPLCFWPRVCRCVGSVGIRSIVVLFGFCVLYLK